MNKALYNLIRTHYQTLQGYVSAGMEVKKEASTIFMNANENPYELPGLEGFNRYPEPQPQALAEAFAALYGVDADNIVTTRGADEAIMIMIRLFCEPHRDSILMHPPTFGMYPVDANAMPAGIVEVPLIKKDGTFALDVDGIIAGAKKPSVKVVVICSPNNPTATAFPHAEIERICRETEGHAVVLLDETYAEFSVQGSLVPKFAAYPNLIILRTLSKSYSMAGMRMGSILCADKEFIKLVRTKCLDAYPLPKASIDAAIRVATPAMQDVAKQNREKLLIERDRLREAFAAHPLVRHVYPSDANFILIEMIGAKKFIEYCAKEKIILRDFSTKKLTEDCIRISPDLPENNDKLLKLLTSFAG